MQSRLILTRDRVAQYCIGLLICAAILQTFSLIQGKKIGGDFAVFYAEGLIAAKYSHAELYNTDLQDKEYAAIVGPQTSSPFAYAPWFTLPLELLARLPYLVAFLLWTTLSLFSLWTAYRLLSGAVNLPKSWDLVGFVACLAFPPYLFYSLLNGQPTAFALLILSASFVLQQQGRKYIAGLMLALLTYKLTLLVFLVPMLLFMREWRVFFGLTVGGAILLVVSLLWAGVQGCVGFLKLLLLYSKVLTSPVEVFQTEKYIDVGSAIRLLFGPQPIVRLLPLLALPLLCFIWYRVGNRPISWSIAVLAGLLLSLYSPIYDTTALIFVVLLFGITRISTWLLISLYLIPAVSVRLASVSRVQLFTVLLTVLATILLRSAFSESPARQLESLRVGSTSG